MESIRINRKFEPLFHPTQGVRYYVVTGGRAPGKSFAVSTALNSRTYDSPYTTLFTRYSMVSADVSIIPEFTEKMDICNNRLDFIAKKDEILNLVSGGRIVFKGILQSRKNNDARLKSVHNVQRFVLDEAQELTDEKQFDIIDLSIRLNDVPCEVWLILNPTDIHHWIYRRFFREPGVPDDFNGVKGNVCYIHTTYLENLEHLDPTFIALADRMKESNYERYKNVFLGYWARRSDGIIYGNWVRDPEAERMTCRSDCWYGLDWGFSNDPTALVRIWHDSDTGIVWFRELCYLKGLLIGQIAEIVRRDQQLCSAPEAFVYCDPARPEHIAELRRSYGINAVPADNRDKAGRVDWLRGCTVRYEGANMEAEAELYSFLPSNLEADTFTNIPQDGGDHLMDAANYGTVTHLRRQGIPNSYGEV